ncbi:hypothetical protein ScPMuIL_016945 [Solemya velum]
MLKKIFSKKFAYYKLEKHCVETVITDVCLLQANTKINTQFPREKAISRCREKEVAVVIQAHRREWTIKMTSAILTMTSTKATRKDTREQATSRIWITKRIPVNRRHS